MQDGPPIWIIDPVYRALAAFPVASFTLTVITDIAYMQTSNLLWLHFSEWLLLAGLIVGLVAGIYLGIRLVIRTRRPSWGHALGGILVLLLAALNSFIHTVDGWTAVVPFGLLTSVATVFAMIVTGFLGWKGARHV